MKLPAATRIGTVSLNVSDVEAVAAFYQDGVGLTRLEEDDDGVVLGSAGAPLLALLHRPELPNPSAGAAGLFHTAVLFEERPALAAALYATATKFSESFTGSADHLVSLAFYFDDPEGNGVELYWDRPRDDWRWQDGTVAMDTLPLDPNRFIAEHHGGASEPAAPVGAAATIGHVHLKVGDIEAARSFYVDTLGFDVTVGTWPGALFVSAGGYHHHLGMNVWQSRGAPPREPSLGLAGFETLVPDHEALSDIARRLDGSGVEFESSPDGLTFMDPWNTRVSVRALA